MDYIWIFLLTFLGFIVSHLIILLLQKNKISKFFSWLLSALICFLIAFAAYYPAENSTTLRNTETIYIIEEPVPQTEAELYITPHGKRYHLSSTCGGVNAQKTSLELAKRMGYTPCQKCVH